MVLLALFPLFAVLITECNQAQHLGDFIDFVVQLSLIHILSALLAAKDDTEALAAVTGAVRRFYGADRAYVTTIDKDGGW